MISLGALASMTGGGLAALQSSDVRLEATELRLPRWDADGFQVAVVSDIHANDSLSAARTRKAVRLAIQQRPDLIVLPGDFLNFSWSYTIDTMLDAIVDLHEARCPVLGVMGNHDYWTADPGAILSALDRRSGVKMLLNEVADVQGVKVVGLDDAMFGTYRPSVVSEHDSRSLLVLLHEPDYVDQTPDNASLQISGHSHGGQICLPGGAPIALPRGARRYVKGFYSEARVPLYVTRGVGTVGRSMRTFCPPEVSLLTIRSSL